MPEYNITLFSLYTVYIRLSQLYTYREIDENVKKCWRNERNDKCIDGIS